MRNYSAGFISAACRVALISAWLSAITAAFAAGAINPPSAEPYDFASPKLLTGTLYEIGSMRTNILYTFRRTATRSGTTVNVERQFIGTNGSIAAVENIVYESGRLVSVQMQEFQAQVSGSVHIEPNPKDPLRQKLFIGYAHGLNPPDGEAQNLQPDTLFDDTIYPFMMAHWDDLMQGHAVKFRFISLEHERTFEFRLVKIEESIQNGWTVEKIKMEPVSIFVSELLKPLIFTVEKDSPHHILSYTGRTTPRIKKGNSWKYLDAETVFNW
jgi:hypothetical protein